MSISSKFEKLKFLIYKSCAPLRLFQKVVWGPGKTPEQIAAIMRAFSEYQEIVMATRISPEVHVQVKI